MSEIKDLLDSLVFKYNRPDFIEHDPISIPHQYKLKQDIEIAAFMAAIFSWGQRITIINKSKEFLGYMDNKPYEFIIHHSEKELKPFLKFKHRTFNDTDALYFISFLKYHYNKHSSLEEAFLQGDIAYTLNENVEQHLIGFKKYFFSLDDFPQRTSKHISSPMSNATCKRINMFLRWMVRKDKMGVDFGLWKKINAHQLLIPIDVHVATVSRQLGLLNHQPLNWKQVLELTQVLKKYDEKDPVKYDYALFGLGIEQKK